MRALFLSDHADIQSDRPGGVQLCTQEFQSYLGAAFGKAEVFTVQSHQTFSSKFLRRFGLAAYRAYQPEQYRSNLTAVIAREEITHVFINRTEPVRFASLLKSLRPELRIVLMSHGNQSGDDLYDLAGPEPRWNGLNAGRATLALGLNLVTESRHRHRYIDGVCVMSAEEEVLEQWLGARRTFILPRRLDLKPLDWQPVPGRVGYVATLDHPPNQKAIHSVCAELQRNGTSVEVRLVGAPESAGRRIANEFPFVRYVGALSESELRAEAATWSAFLNPIFWLARGASMKLATGLGYGLPVISTRFGARGYDFGNEFFPVSGNEAKSFVELLLKTIADAATARSSAEISKRVVSTAPSVTDVGKRLREFSQAL